MKQKFSIQQMCITALFMALVCVATMVIQISIPLGYAHLGDCMILFTAYMFGPVVGALASGIGSALADIFTGFAIWAVATLIIKTIMPLIAWAFFRKSKEMPTLLASTEKVLSVKVIAGSIVTLLFMVICYVIAGAILYGSVAMGIASAPGLLIKAVVNFAVFIVLTLAVSTPLKKYLRN